MKLWLPATLVLATVMGATLPSPSTASDTDPDDHLVGAAINARKEAALLIRENFPAAEIRAFLAGHAAGSLPEAVHYPPDHPGAGLAVRLVINDTAGPGLLAPGNVVLAEGPKAPP